MGNNAELKLLASNLANTNPNLRNTCKKVNNISVQVSKERVE